MIEIHNNGQDILSTNYWQTEHSERGYLYCSINAGCFRLLIPPAQESQIPEMQTAREVIVSRGAWPEAGKLEAIEIMFEDDSDSPYCLHLGSEQLDQLPLDADRDRPGQPPRWKFSAHTRAGKAFELPCRYRVVKKIPYLKPF